MSALKTPRKSNSPSIYTFYLKKERKKEKERLKNRFKNFARKKVLALEEVALKK